MLQILVTLHYRLYEFYLMFIWLCAFTYDLVAIVWSDFQLRSYRIYSYRFAVIRGVPARRMKQIECLCETNPIDSTLFALCFEPCLLHACLYGHVMPIFVCFAPISMSCPRDHTTTELGTRSKKEISRVPVAIGCRVPRRVC